MLLASASISGQDLPLPETAHSNIEYKSVSDALTSLRNKPGVEIEMQDDWTIIVEPALMVIWSFAPERHAAYPAVVKRAIVEKDGKVNIEMGVICQATKSACDALVREFFQLNERMRSSLQSKSDQTR